MFKEEYKTLLEKVKIRWFSFIEDTLVVHLKRHALKKKKKGVHGYDLLPWVSVCRWICMEMFKVLR